MDAMYDRNRFEEKQKNMTSHILDPLQVLLSLYSGHFFVRLLLPSLLTVIDVDGLYLLLLFIVCFHRLLEFSDSTLP
jgi:hypothetical protein